ncbi:hypothetical protein GQ43DRAFT_476503 [Delitschia confertaspora ATCC 74209]|uniref:Pentatricopeptide repeat domain protein n=1 Tax=Delitschia confertaspora ATCC 74209 TaxID=1513339 RepID=A0A9P4JGG7_9PLEO|nr:hypothetical protein GQ43DRAFT_476503 [Delitschia confertaspora ATCC 74209]
MLGCRACLWRYIRAVTDDASVTSHRSARRNGAALLNRFGQQRQSFRTSAPVAVASRASNRPQYAEDDRSSQKRPSFQSRDRWKESTQAESLKRSARKELIRRPKREGDDPKTRKIGRRDPNIPANEWDNRRKELQHLVDPLELAEFVKAELRKGRVKEMMLLVQMASNNMQCIVSWNHIIDHHLREGRVAQAVKIYNDMKKRAQFPDSYTYTILLRGLADNAHDSGAVARALSVYHSLFAPNSRVQPSIIHTNAALKVCSRANDMDALWGVASKIPEKGPAAANAITYATILNAIHQSLLVKPPPGESEEQLAMRRERGIVEGRRIWEDVISKWRNADLVMSEQLVCAMGRLLLIGSRPRDWDDVLSLVEQTMDIPRLVPRLGTPAREEAGYPRLRAPNVPEALRVDDDHLGPDKGPARGDEFLPVTTKGIGTSGRNALNYAIPSNDTLSMITDACLKVVANKASTEYWNLLTDPTSYNIKPDLNNLNQRLRMMRQNRASEDAVALLQQSFIANGLTPRPGTFRIAMSTCKRDKNNHNSLKHAGQLLDMMMSTLEDADPKTVNWYADLAIDFPLAKGSDLVDAVQRLKPVVKNIRLQLGVGTDARFKGEEDEIEGEGGAIEGLKGTEREDAMNALRRVYGLYDRLVSEDFLQEEEKPKFKRERAALSAFLSRVQYKDGKRRREAREAREVIKGEGESEGNAQGRDEVLDGKKDDIGGVQKKEVEDTKRNENSRGGWDSLMAASQRTGSDRRNWAARTGKGRNGRPN